MRLWLEFFKCVFNLRKACSRTSTFVWMVFALIGFSTNPDKAGVTSLVRASFMKSRFYPSFLHFFNSSVLKVHQLTTCWISLALKLFRPVLFEGHLVLLLDGLKVPKEGKKMPAVKKLRQPSANNSKAPFIFGHSFQALGLLVHASSNSVQSIPLAARIHEGIILSSLHKKNLYQKAHLLLSSLFSRIPQPLLIVADAYYATESFLSLLLNEDNHLLTRVKHNAVAFKEAHRSCRRKRGRPKLYGEKVVFRDLWEKENLFKEATMSFYGGPPVTFRYCFMDLLWKPAQRKVRFILVEHPYKGRIILMTTMLSMDPFSAIRLYAARFKIEVAFKTAIHTVGAFAYRFWTKLWKPNKGRRGDQFLHKKGKMYREKSMAKIDAYHRFIQLGFIGQGLLLHLAINFGNLVWASFPTWLRTMRTNSAPSEWVVAETLKSLLPQFLLGKAENPALKKFLAGKIDLDKPPGISLSA